MTSCKHECEDIYPRGDVKEVHWKSNSADSQGNYLFGMLVCVFVCVGGLYMVQMIFLVSSTSLFLLIPHN